MKIKTSKGIILSHGLILGSFWVLLHLTMYYAGVLISLARALSILNIVVFIVIVVLGISRFKKVNNDVLSFEQAVKIGVGIAIVATSIETLYSYIFSKFIDPDLSVKLLREVAHYTEEQIKIIKQRSPFIKSAMGIIPSAIGGFIVSAITGAVLQNKKGKEQG